MILYFLLIAMSHPHSWNAFLPPTPYTCIYTKQRHVLFQDVSSFCGQRDTQKRGSWQKKNSTAAFVNSWSEWRGEKSKKQKKTQTCLFRSPIHCSPRSTDYLLGSEISECVQEEKGQNSCYFQVLTKPGWAGCLKSLQCGCRSHSLCSLFLGSELQPEKDFTKTMIWVFFF